MTSTSPSLEERQKTAASDLSSLGRVSHRLALVDTSERLQQVLEKLLPRLLKRIGDNHQQQLSLARDGTDNDTAIYRQLKDTLDKIQAKLVEMLSHAMKRVRDDKTCKLPCKDILELLLEESTIADSGTNKEAAAVDTPKDTQAIPKAKASVDPFTLNLALAFLTLGLPRTSTREEVEALLPSLLVLVGHYSGLAAIRTPAKKMQSHQVGHLLLRAIEWLVEDEKKLMKSPLLGIKSRKSDPTAGPSTRDVAMTLARTVCEQDSRVAGAVFDLILDGILYQPVAGNVPPPGLSQSGHERLKSGSSSTERDWAAEKAPSLKLMEFKLALLDFIAPSRRWALFAGSTNDAANASRTVALLVAATGDSNPEVSQRATTYLKMHHDSFRGSNSTTEATTTDDDDDCGADRPTAVGDPVRLVCGLLSIAFGQTNAESAMTKVVAGGTNMSDNTWLGMIPEQAEASDSSQLVLSLKRRAVMESATATIMKYVGDKILEENPQLFKQAEQVQQLATLPVLVAQRTLSNLRTSSGLSALQARPFAAAAQLLNVLCVRLAAFYDSELATRKTSERSISNECNAAILTLMARALVASCVVLAPASTPISRTSSAGVISNDGSVAIRDACYGVVCSLSRSQFTMAKEGYIFTRGTTNTQSQNNSVSIDTASLLFGCAANEIENLRPRAVAALDALLGAYCRVFLVDNNPQPTAEPVVAAEAELNPWAATVSSAKKTTPSGNSEIKAQVDVQQVVKSLLPLLWSASQTSQSKASRVAAARWSSDLIKAIDVTSACHLLCFLSGDSDVTASSIAREGLGLRSKQSIATSAEDNLDDTIPRNGQLPDFGDYISIVFQQSNTGSFWRPQYRDMSSAGKAAAIRFGLVCLFSDLYGGEHGALKVFVSTLADTLILFGSKANGVTNGSKAQGRDAIELLEDCASALLATLTTSQYARKLIVPDSSSDSSEVSLSLKDIEFLALTANSSRARRLLASSCGRLYTDSSLWQSDVLEGMDQWLQGTQVHSTLETCAMKLEGIQHSHSTAEVHGASFLGAQCVRAFRLAAVEKKTDGLVCWQNASTILQALGCGILNSDDIIANACADALSAALSYDFVDAPMLDQRIFDATASAINKCAQGLKKFSSIEHVDAPRAAKIVGAAGTILAASTSGAGAVSENSKDGSVDLGPARLSCVQALFALLGSPAFKADEEIALKVGEALGSYADAVSGGVWSSPDTSWPREYDENHAQELPPHQQVLYTLLRKVFLSNNPQQKVSCGPALLGIVGRACRAVNKSDIYAQRNLVVEINKNLVEVQNVFIALLSHPKSKHLSRESCCLGLAACRGLTKIAGVKQESESGEESSIGSEELNHRLLKAFGQTSNYGGSAYQETAQQAAQRRAAERGESAQSGMEQFGEESEVGGASGLGEAALQSYKEMAAAAVSLGRLDVLYALLMLSISHPAWFAGSNKHKYSAASLLGEDSIVGSRTNSSELRAALRPHLGKLLPRILRATHDPQQQTREQMNSLWVGLTGGGSESRAAITEHLLPTIDTLIEDATNKLWRARAGACGALAEILVGRSWEELGGGPAQLDDDDVHTKTSSSKLTAGIRILRLFRVSMRALDDVRINVREAGETLARTMRALSVRLCTRSLREATDGTMLGKQAMQSHERNAGAASATVLRWLIKHGLNQKCAEATGICLSCLVEIIDIVQPKILQPLIPDLLLSLLLSMSSLEPAALNYLQARSGSQEADSSLSYDSLQQFRLRLAQSGPIARAVSKLLDMLPSVSVETQRQVVPQLDAALRQSVGFASRAATADAVSTLTQSCPNAFKFPGAGNTNPSVRLLRALYFASERERGQGARDKMIHSLGNLAALCPGSSVRVLAKKACDRYTTATGNNDDPVSRRAGAAALRSIAVRASNQLSDGGPGNIWARVVMPVAFLGKKDDDQKVAALWHEVWEEGSIQIDVSNSSGDNGFGGIEENLLPYLVEESSNSLNALSWSRRVAGASALVDLCHSGVLSPTPRSLTSSNASDTHSIERSRRRAQASQKALSTSLGLLLKSRLWTGKSEVITAVVAVAGKWTSAVIDKDSTDETLFGWAGPGPCPWQPISVTENVTADLFVGDGWFREKKGENGMDEDEDLPQQPQASDVEYSGETKELSFDDADQLPENEDEKKEGDVEESRFKASMTATFAGVARFLLDQAMPGEASKALTTYEEYLPYRVAAFKGLRDLMGSLAESSTGGTEIKTQIYQLLAPKLIAMCTIREDSSKSEEPPVLVARAMDCLGACFFESIGTKSDEIESGSSNVLELTSILLAAGGDKQSAWTVREASRLCLASLASKCHPSALRDHKVVDSFVESADKARKDRKFWKVRLSGLKLLRALVSRAGSRQLDGKEQERQLLLEGMLPMKESILAIARASLSDPESQVTALSSDLISMMSWWP